jgi:hypothetical protein
MIWQLLYSRNDPLGMGAEEGVDVVGVSIFQKLLIEAVVKHNRLDIVKWNSIY